MNWSKIRNEIDVIGHFHEIIKTAEIKKTKVLNHFDSKLDKLELHLLKLENDEKQKLEEINNIRIENERIQQEKEILEKLNTEKKDEQLRLEKIRRIELEKKEQEDVRKEREKIEVIARIEERRKNDLVIMVQCIFRGHSYRRKIRTIADAARAILAETHKQLEDTETLRFALEDETSFNFREVMKEEFERHCFTNALEESGKMNWYVRDDIKSIEREEQQEIKKLSRQRKRLEPTRSRTPKTDELRKRIEAEREAREASLRSFEFIMPGTLEHEHKQHPFRVTKPDASLLASPISTPLSQVRPRPPSQPSVSRAQSPSSTSISPAKSPTTSLRPRPAQQSPVASIRSRPMFPPIIMKDAETGEDLEFTKAIWSSSEGRAEISNPKGLTSYGTGRISINPPAMNSLTEPYKPKSPYKSYAFNSPNRLVGGRQADPDVLNAFLLEQKYSAPTKAMLEEIVKPARHELVDKFLREGPLAPKFHKYWDKKTDSVKKVEDALEDGYEPVNGRVDELVDEEFQEVLSEASSETNATQSIQTAETESDMWSGTVLTEDSNLLAFNDIDDSSIIPPQLELKNKKFWKKIERESYENIFDIISKLEWNKKWTHEKTVKVDEIRKICIEIARWKTNNLKLVIASIASEHGREKVRANSEWKLASMGKSKRHELAKLKQLNEKERHDKRTFYRNMQYDNEILLINKLDKYGLIF